MKRILSPYEKNHLLRSGINPEQIDQYGEMPVEYITGRVSFLGREFSISPAVLIPRVETEELVELIYYDLFKRTNQNKPIKIIEVGTGSGVIGLSLIKFMEQQQIKYQLTLTDISEDALEITQENFQTLFPNQPEFGQVKFLQTDLLLDIEQHQLDYLIANLPYVPTARLTQLDKSVKDYEPLLALAGGQAGLQLIERLLVQARRLLNPTSKVFLEIDDTHTKQLLERVVEGYEFELVRDQFGKNRFAIGQLA